LRSSIALSFLVRLRIFFWAASSSIATLASAAAGGSSVVVGVAAPEPLAPSAFLFLVRWRFFFSPCAAPGVAEGAPGIEAPGIYRWEGLPPLKIGVDAPELGALSSSRRYASEAAEPRAPGGRYAPTGLDAAGS